MNPKSPRFVAATLIYSFVFGLVSFIPATARGEVRQQIQIETAEPLTGEKAIESLKESGTYDSLKQAIADASGGENTSQLFANGSYEEVTLTATGGAASDQLGGNAIAIYGDTVVAGDLGSDIGANTNQGAAYVFVRSGNTWTQQAKLTASDGATNDYFGHGVSIWQDTIVVGAAADDGTLTDQGSAYIFTRTGTTWTQQAKVVAADPGTNDQFGYGVDIYGDTAVIGSPFDDTGAASDQGSAYVFTRSGSTWTQQQKLNGADSALGDHFGAFVSIWGDTAMIAADSADVSGRSNQGAAYAFTRSGTTWTQQQKLTASDGVAGDQLGLLVDLNGDTTVVGAFGADIGGRTNQGAAYVFVRSGTTWTQQQKLTASDGAANDQLYAVGISGDTIILGATGKDVGANANQGAVYVFQRSGTTWTQAQRLTAGDGAANDELGSRIAIYGDTVAAAAQLDDVGANSNQGSVRVFQTKVTNANNTASDGAASDLLGSSVAVYGDTAIAGAMGVASNKGAAYVFTRSGFTWTQQAKLTASDGAASNFFGAGVGISGDTAVVGAYGVSTNTGAVYVYTRSGTTWTQEQKIPFSGSATAPYFGFQVGIDGDTLVVGADGDDLGGLDRGSATVFVRSAGVWSLQQKLQPTDIANGDQFGRRVAISGDTILAGSPLDDDGGTSAGSAYVFTRSGTTWTQQAKLNAPDPAASDYFGESVFIAGDAAVVGARTADVGGNVDQGAAYVFTRSGTTWTLQQKVVAPDGAAGDQFGASVTLSGNNLVIGSPLADVGGNADQGASYLYTLSGSNWNFQRKLTATDGAAGDQFGFSVGVTTNTLFVGAYQDDVGANSNQGSVYSFYWGDGTVTPSPTDVVNSNDSGAGSLRNAVTNSSAGGTITIPTSVTGTVTLTSPISLSKDVTITGPGARSLEIKAPSGQPAFNIASGTTANISGVKISGSGTQVTGNGGVLSNLGTLSLTDVQVSGGSASGSGGGIYSSGPLNATRTTVSGNTAGGDGGGIYSTGLLTLVNSTVAGNTATGKGGGVAAASGLDHTVTNNTISGNTASSGGGIYTGTLTAFTEFTPNAPNAVTVNWMSWTAPSGYPLYKSGTDGGSSYAFYYTSGVNGSLTLPNGTVVNVTMSGEVIDQSCFTVTLTGCPAGYWKGKGWSGYPAGTYTSTNVPSLPPNVNAISQTGFVNNSRTLTFDKPVSNVVMNLVSVGGSAGTASYTFDRSFNILSQDPTCVPSRTSSVNNCLTKSGNTLTGWEGAGTIQFDGTFTSLTYSMPDGEYYSMFNIGVSSAGPVQPAVNMSSNIVTANTGTGSNPDLEGTFKSNGNNWVGNSTGSTGFTNGTNKDIVGTALTGLGSLANNGGDTDTMALASTSGAVDRGIANSLTNDQRGKARSYDFALASNASDGTDIGAYEFTPMTVMNGNNSGTGSLRDTVQNASPGDVIAIPKTAGPINLTTGPITISKDLTIVGPGARDLTINGSGNASGSVVVVNPSVTATVSGITVTGGKGTDNGSGILQGGGFLNKGTLTLTDVQVKGNSANQGGGVYNGATSTFYANRATIGGGNSASNGAGIYSTGYMEIINSTVSGNVATGTGGGIWLAGTASALVSNTTISANIATTTAGGYYYDPPAFTGSVDGLAVTGAVVRSSIIAGNTLTSNFGMAPSGVANPDVDGTFTDQGYNLIGAGDGGNFTNGVNNNIVGSKAALQDPGLDPLGSYGGGTDTMRLKSTSAAIQKGKAFSLTTDARGNVRTWYTTGGFTPDATFDGTDVGAYEYSYTTAAGVKISGTVRDASGAGIARARVTVYDTETGSIATLRTNQFGRYEIDDLEIGRMYVVTVSTKASSTKLQRTVMLYEALTDVDFNVNTP